MEQIKWYQSKLVWLGVLITLQGFVPVLVELVEKQSISVADILFAFSGLATIVIRVWFTESAIQK